VIDLLNKEQLDSCKTELLARKKQLLRHLKDDYGLSAAMADQSISELSSYDNHPGDLGTELFEREKDLALDMRTKDELYEIEHALKKLEAHTYGLCEICHQPIALERLQVIPTATTCVNHTKTMNVSKRPTEETTISPTLNEKIYREENTLFDEEDSWQQVEMFGSSNTPSDYFQSENEYNHLYTNSDELIGSVEALEGFLLADIHGKYIGVNEKHERYENYLDENHVESIFYTND
jgi:YteA family regulatory protein